PTEAESRRDGGGGRGKLKLMPCALPNGAHDPAQRGGRPPPSLPLAIHERLRTKALEDRPAGARRPAEKGTLELLSHDIFIGGGAEVPAAIAVGEENPRLSVGVVSKVYPMRSHTVSAEGGAAAVIKPNDSLDDHAKDTITGSDWLADQDAVEVFVKEAVGEMIQLEHWGCPWSREPDGHVAVRPFGGMKIERTWFAAGQTGFHMLDALFQTSLKYPNITRYDEWFVCRLLVDDGRVQGVAAIELRTGAVRAIAGK